jgi:hypothetical protein
MVAMVGDVRGRWRGEMGVGLWMGGCVSWVGFGSGGKQTVYLGEAESMHVKFACQVFVH